MSGNSGRYRWDPAEGKLEKISDSIPSVSSDAYFKEPYHDEHLADDKHPHGQEVRSKKHKARLLKSMGRFERGDRVHGARTKFDGSGLNAFK